MDTKKPDKIKSVKISGLYLKGYTSIDLLDVLESTYIVSEIKGVLHYDLFVSLAGKQEFKGTTIHRIHTAGGWSPLPEDFGEWAEIIDLTSSSMSDPFNDESVSSVS